MTALQEAAEALWALEAAQADVTDKMDALFGLLPAAAAECEAAGLPGGVSARVIGILNRCRS